MQTLSLLWRSADLGSQFKAVNDYRFKSGIRYTGSSVSPGTRFFYSAAAVSGKLVPQLVIATGVSYRRLEVPSLERFAEVGVFYGAAMSEAPACTGEEVVIVGSGNSAGQAAVHLSTVRFAGHDGCPWQVTSCEHV